ncbi:hypothetical protein [Fodinibius sp.]|uniref:hypothetical protein n=1 Tax=Fodinibius sp. TaxID=1872440 RepID=UPI002ACE78AE|nr:hypothetical protein [Fodinibius sp.]MDZ7659448.1 hypothetical protein [Fodinibius sp.]
MPSGPSREIESSSTPAGRVSETGVQLTSSARRNSPGSHTQWLYKSLFWLCLTVLLVVSLIPDISFNQEFTPLGIRKDYAL